MILARGLHATAKTLDRLSRSLGHGATASVNLGIRLARKGLFGFSFLSFTACLAVGTSLYALAAVAGVAEAFVSAPMARYGYQSSGALGRESKRFWGALSSQHASRPALESKDVLPPRKLVTPVPPQPPQRQPRVRWVVSPKSPQPPHHDGLV